MGKITKKLIAGLMTALMATLTLVSPVLALTVEEECLNATHVIESWNNTITIDGVPTISDSEQLVDCNSGCSTTIGRCRPDDMRLSIYVLMIVFVSLIITAIGVMFFRDYSIYVEVINIFAHIMILGFTDIFINNYEIIIGGSLLLHAGIIYDIMIARPNREKDKHNAP